MADPVGACCDPRTCACTVTTQADCQPPDLWLGPGTNCTPSPCDCPPGACCDPTTGVCTFTCQCSCQAPNIWQGPATTCVPNTCPQPTGACCLGNLCLVATRSDCAIDGGTYLGDRLPCNPNPCTPTSSVEERLGDLALRNILAIPNPSTGQVLILYRLQRAAVVTLEIFDASGAVVRRLAEGQQPAGAHVTRWDGRNDAGEQLPSGAYFTRIETPAGVVTGKVVLSR